MGADRMPPLAAEALNAAQREAAAAFRAGRGVEPFGPFLPLLRSPEVLTHASSLGEYLRYRSAIGTMLSELAILIVAREWTQDYEWHVHYPIALKAGIRKEIADAIADARRPQGMSEDETTVYEFSVELNRNRRVSDATYARAAKRFGEQGVIDLTAINGYYTFLAMTMNATRTPIPADGKKLPRLPE